MEEKEVVGRGRQNDQKLKAFLILNNFCSSSHYYWRVSSGLEGLILPLVFV